MFLIQVPQYVVVAVAYTIGRPFRQPMHMNIPFIINVLILVVLQYYVILCPDSFTKYVFDVCDCFASV